MEKILARKKVGRPSMAEGLSGCCPDCWYVCLRANRVGCTLHGLPRNVESCGDHSPKFKVCDCGSRMFFEEIMMPHPFQRSLTFPGGHYFCEGCGSVKRSSTSDSHYAEWVEDLLLQDRALRYNQDQKEKDL